MVQVECLLGANNCSGELFSNQYQSFETTFDLIDAFNVPVKMGYNSFFLNISAFWQRGSTIYFESNDTQIELIVDDSIPNFPNLFWWTKNDSIVQQNLVFNFRVFVDDIEFLDHLTVEHVYDTPGSYRFQSEIIDIPLNETFIVNVVLGKKKLLLYLYI